MEFHGSDRKYLFYVDADCHEGNANKMKND